VAKAAKKTLQNETIITKWSPDLLRLELDTLLWNGSESIGIKKLWECLCSYGYLPRLANAGVLEDAIRKGAISGRFAYASGFDGERYLGLKLGQPTGEVEPEGLLVKVGAAKKQQDDAEAPPEALKAPKATAHEKAAKKRFHMSAALGSPRDVQKHMEEIIERLSSLGGAKVSISIDVEAEMEDGFSQQVIRAVSENCQALNVPEFGFDE
jgi:hypothetical protein